MSPGLRTLLAMMSTGLFAIMTLAMLVVGLVTDYTIGSVILALFFGAIAVFSAYHTFLSFRASRQGDVPLGHGQDHARLLKLAARQSGRLTAEEAAIECRISRSQAEQLLDDLVNQGSADTWVSDSGAIVYVFRGLLEDEKESAEDPLKMLGP